MLTRNLAIKTLKVTSVLGEIQMISTLAESGMNPAHISMDFWGKQISSKKYFCAFDSKQCSPAKKKNTQDVSHPVLL